jgi:hypothetical protein
MARRGRHLDPPQPLERRHGGGGGTILAFVIGAVLVMVVVIGWSVYSAGPELKTDTLDFRLSRPVIPIPTNPEPLPIPVPGRPG